MRRVIKYTNVAVAALLGVLLVAGYFWFRQTMPDTSGEMILDLVAEAKITRDKRGIAHIEAASIEDAIYLQGFAHAQDRFWQMEATRRLAAGELAEVAGPAALESDINARQLRLRRLAQQMVENLEPEDRRWFAAYARGVNDWLNLHEKRLPLEIQALGYSPRPWRIADSMLLVVHMYRQLSTSWTVEADQFLMLNRAVDKEKVRELFPTRTGTEIQPGSNAWALAGSRTQSGKPILAGDPHLQQSWPSTFYLNHLKAGALDVIGASLPGGPGIIIGHNQKIAWSMTTLHFDVQDLYFNDSTLIGVEKETIRVKGGKTVELNLQITPHGPVLERNGMRFSLKWTGFDSRYPFAFRDLNLAQDWSSFRKALKRFPGPCHNFVYADTTGNIGYQAAGNMPLRKTAAAGLPLDARQPQNEWQGYIPFDKLPSAFNPAGGMLVNANQNPFPENYEYPVTGVFTPPYRQHQISRLLAARGKWQATEMTAVQKDVYSAFHHFLARQLVAAGEKRKASREDFSVAIEELKSWNGQMEIGMAAPMIASMVYEELKRVLVRRVANMQTGFDSHFAPSVIENLLRTRPKSWFPDFDQVLVEALLTSLEAGAKLHGKNPRFWDYGRYNRISLSNTVLAEAITIGKFLTPSWMPFADSLRTLRIPLIENFVQVGPMPLSGTTQSVKQVSARIGPAFRFIADTADWENSFMTLTLGQSGHPFSAHSRDYWEAYYGGEAVPLPYKNFEPEAVLRLRPRPQN